MKGMRGNLIRYGRPVGTAPGTQGEGGGHTQDGGHHAGRHPTSNSHPNRRFFVNGRLQADKTAQPGASEEESGKDLTSLSISNRNVVCLWVA